MMRDGNGWSGLATCTGWVRGRLYGHCKELHPWHGFHAAWDCSQCQYPPSERSAKQQMKPTSWDIVNLWCPAVVIYEHEAWKCMQLLASSPTYPALEAAQEKHLRYCFLSTVQRLAQVKLIASTTFSLCAQWNTVVNRALEAMANLFSSREEVVL